MEALLTLPLPGTPDAWLLAGALSRLMQYMESLAGPQECQKLPFKTHDELMRAVACGIEIMDVVQPDSIPVEGSVLTERELACCRLRKA